MHRTFEELAGQEIDGLYHGALFLKAGEEAAAEDLVLWTLTGAFQSFRRGLSHSDASRWLEDKLVRAFLAGEAPAGEAPLDSEDGPIDGAEPVRFPSAVRAEIDPQALFMAAERVPPRARAALWLVIFRRWTYDDASRVLDTNRASLKDLLSYRHVLLTAIMRGSSEQSGANGFQT
jgi:DNA-directed RNA polymerase specialized sigma24 family protein